MKANKRTSFLITKTSHDDKERSEAMKLFDTLKADGLNPSLTEGVAFFNISYEEKVEL